MHYKFTILDFTIALGVVSQHVEGRRNDEPLDTKPRAVGSTAAIDTIMQASQSRNQ